MADVVSIFMMTKWFHYHVLCSANRGLTDEWNDTTQLLLDAARNAQSPELLQVLAQNVLFQYSVFLHTRIGLPDKGIYVVCVCVCVCGCVWVGGWMGGWVFMVIYTYTTTKSSP